MAKSPEQLIAKELATINTSIAKIMKVLEDQAAAKALQASKPLPKAGGPTSKTKTDKKPAPKKANKKSSVTILK